MSLCLAAGAAVATIAAETFTLAWTHSIEKTRWEEDWRIAGGGLVLVEARIRATGAGMEPPPGSTLRDGIWHYRPDLPLQAVLHLAHSPHAGGYELCVAGRCAPLAEQLPGLASEAVVEVSPCN